MVHPVLMTALILDTLGKLMVSFTAIMVHHRFLKEHRIDEDVFKEMRREQLIGISGVICIVLGSGTEILFSAGILTL